MSAPSRLAEQVTVVVPAHERKSQVLLTLRQLNTLEARVPVCVVDADSSDGTAAAIARRFPDVLTYRFPASRGVAAINVAVRHADTPYIAFCEPGTWWAWGALTRAVKLLESAPRVGVLNARVLRGAARAEDAICGAMGRSALASPLGVLVTGVGDVNPAAAVLRRAAFLSVGGLEPRLAPGAEGRLLAYELMSAGWTLGYARGLVVYGQIACAAAEYLPALMLRNQLCLAWARRRFRAALDESLELLANPMHATERATGVLLALRSLFWVMKRRRMLPASVEEALHQIRCGAAPEQSAMPDRLSGAQSSAPVRLETRTAFGPAALRR